MNLWFLICVYFLSEFDCCTWDNPVNIHLDSIKRLDKVDETCFNQLPNVSKVFHPFDLTVYLPIHHYGPSAASTTVGAYCCEFHNSGWGDAWLEKEDETF